MKQTKLSSVAQELCLAFEAGVKARQKSDQEESVKVSEAISSVANVYEKVRNLIDYKEDHLFRVSAIERFLLRLLTLKKNQSQVGESLIKELIRSGYLLDQGVDQSKVKTVNQIMDKYRRLLVSLPIQNGLKKWLIGIAASEIEKTLAPQIEDDALVAAFYRLISPNVTFPQDQEKAKNIQLFICAQRVLLKPSLATLRYNLLLGYLPDWPQADPKEVEVLVTKFPQLAKKIDDQINSSQYERLYYFCRRYAAPFLILRELMLIDPKNNQKTLTKPEALESLVLEVCEAKYAETRTKLTRAASRSIIYIFLTKMLFAIFLEIPFELFFFQQVKRLPLVINTLFPLALMFGFTLTVPRPSTKNSQLIFKKIRGIVYQGTFKTQPFEIKAPSQKSVSLRQAIFRLIYFLTFFISFGLVVWVLSKLDFSIFSTFLADFN